MGKKYEVVKQMTVPYTLANGKIIELEVSEAVARLLADFKREDENYRRKMRRHNEISLDALHDDTDFEPADPNANIEEDYIAQEEKYELRAAIQKLNKKDREFIQALYYDEVSAQDYAIQKKLTFQAVYKRLLKIYGKIKNILSGKVE